MERPLRIRYEATEEGIERAMASKPILAELTTDDGTKARGR